MNNSIKALILLTITTFSTLPSYLQASAIEVHNKIEEHEEQQNNSFNLTIGFGIAALGAAAVMAYCINSSDQAESKLFKKEIDADDIITFYHTIDHIKDCTIGMTISCGLASIFYALSTLSYENYLMHKDIIKDLKKQLALLLAQHIDNCGSLNISVTLN